MITGKILVEMGYKPAPWFGKAIVEANSKKLEGEELKKFLDSKVPEEPTYIKLHDKPAPLHLNIKAFSIPCANNLQSVEETMNELLKTPTLLEGAVMPDACPAGSVGTIPVGGIVIAKNAIHPGMHSADICCSLYSTNIGKVSPLDVLNTASAITKFGPIGRNDGIFKLPKELENQILNNSMLNDSKSLNFAKTHLGTQGDGNHFLFVGISAKTGNTHIITHHGSRGFGAELFRKGLKVADKFRKNLSPDTLKQNAWIPYDTEEGKTYWEALQIVRQWTKLNHSLLHKEIIKNLGINPDTCESFWNEHNFVFKEGDLFYHAKGATPLLSSMMPDAHTDTRIVPLNMAEPILFISGKRTESNLGFAPHGAGRNFSRKKYLESLSEREKINLLEKSTKNLDVRFFSGKPDLTELPDAYKPAAIIKRQIVNYDLGEVLDHVVPYGCIMAGKQDYR